jgi:hypothetical protein
VGRLGCRWGCATGVSGHPWLLHILGSHLDKQVKRHLRCDGVKHRMKKTVESVWLVYKGRRFLGFVLVSAARRNAQTPEEPHLQDQAGLGFTVPKNVWYNMILRKTVDIEKLQDLKNPRSNSQEWR